MLGTAYDSDDSRAAPWVKVVAAFTPLALGGTAGVAYLIDPGAGVGVLVGALVSVPVALLAREWARR